jgi:hypothetical protein
MLAGLSFLTQLTLGLLGFDQRKKMLMKRLIAESFARTAEKKDIRQNINFAKSANGLKSIVNVT